MKPDTAADLFLVSDYRTLMGAFVERKLALGLTNLDLDDRGGLAGGYTSKLFCGSKRLGLETLGKLLVALEARIIVVPANAELSTPKLTKTAIPIRDLTPLVKEKFRELGRLGGRKRVHLQSPRRRKAIAAMAGRASGEARRLRKQGREVKPKTADPAVLRKLERRPVKPKP
jgi:hypothetical protein